MMSMAKKKVQLPKKSIYILDTVSTARRWTDRAPGWRPLSSGVYVLSSPRRDKPRVAIKTYAQSEFIITLQHIERLQDAPPMRFDLIEVIFSQR